MASGAYASAVRLQPEDILKAGLSCLPLNSAPVRRTQHLACVLVHVVCVAWRLCGREEGERVRRRVGGGESVDGCVRGVRHSGDGAREETDGNGVSGEQRRLDEVSGCREDAG